MFPSHCSLKTRFENLLQVLIFGCFLYFKVGLRNVLIFTAPNTSEYQKVTNCQFNLTSQTARVHHTVNNLTLFLVKDKNWKLFYSSFIAFYSSRLSGVSAKKRCFYCTCLVQGASLGRRWYCPDCEWQWCARNLRVDFQRNWQHIGSCKYSWWVESKWLELITLIRVKYSRPSFKRFSASFQYEITT